MAQRSIFQSRRHIFLWGKVGLAAIVFLSGLFPTGTGRYTVQAVEASSQAMSSNTWKGASFPVENFQGYTSPFGYRRSPDGSANQEFHKGLDMAAPQGSYIRNWWAGKVAEVSDNTACGTMVVVQSGSWSHIYCHMEGNVEVVNGQRYLSDREGGIQFPEGQMVPAGARIGRVGMSGRTTGPHLHWGLKFSGQYVDPALVLRAMYVGQTKYGAVPQTAQPQAIQ